MIFLSRALKVAASRRILQKPKSLQFLLNHLAKASHSEMSSMVSMLQNESGIEDVAKNWIQQNGNILKTWILECDIPGHYGVGGKCTPCPPGTYSSTGSLTCELCPIKSYNPGLGAKTCVSCPSKTTTSLLAQSY